MNAPRPRSGPLPRPVIRQHPERRVYASAQEAAEAEGVPLKTIYRRCKRWWATGWKLGDRPRADGRGERA